MTMTNNFKISIFAVLMLIFTPAHSNTIPFEYTGGTYSVRGFPGINGFWSSWLDIGPVTRHGVLTEGVPVYGTLNDVSYTFNSYYNETNIYSGFTATRTFDLLIDSINYNTTFTQEYQLKSIGYYEQVDIFQGETFTINLGINGLLDVTPSSFSLGTGGMGTVSGTMGVSFLLHDVPTIPIPPAFYLFMSGLTGLFGLCKIRSNNRIKDDAQ